MRGQFTKQDLFPAQRLSASQPASPSLAAPSDRLSSLLKVGGSGVIPGGILPTMDCWRLQRASLKSHAPRRFVLCGIFRPK
jgi:hypothetical protein